jgi:hypothetical protein
MMVNVTSVTKMYPSSGYAFRASPCLKQKCNHCNQCGRPYTCARNGAIAMMRLARIEDFRNGYMVTPALYPIPMGQKRNHGDGYSLVTLVTGGMGW